MTDYSVLRILEEVIVTLCKAVPCSYRTPRSLVLFRIAHIMPGVRSVYFCVYLHTLSFKIRYVFIYAQISEMVS
jgi:hypothetical protein